MLTADKKNQLPPFHLFLRYCKRYCKHVILGTWGIPGQAHSKSCYKHVENSVYLHGKKNQLHYSFLSEDTVQIVPTHYSCIHN